MDTFLMKNISLIKNDKGYITSDDSDRIIKKKSTLKNIVTVSNFFKSTFHYIVFASMCMIMARKIKLLIYR